MGKNLTISRNCGPCDWAALPRQMKICETVIRFTGHTYGLDRDDLMYLNRETIPCIIDGRDGFVTIPVEFLQDEQGNQPRGDYIKF